MRFKKLKAVLATILSLGMLFPFANAFAENYGIIYDGGEPLSAENIQIDPDLLSGLTRVGYGANAKFTLSDSPLWKKAYIMALRLIHQVVIK